MGTSAPCTTNISMTSSPSPPPPPTPEALHRSSTSSVGRNLARTGSKASGKPRARPPAHPSERHRSIRFTAPSHGAAKYQRSFQRPTSSAPSPESQDHGCPKRGALQYSRRESTCVASAEDHESAAIHEATRIEASLVDAHTPLLRQERLLAPAAFHRSVVVAVKIYVTSLGLPPPKPSGFDFHKQLSLPVQQ